MKGDLTTGSTLVLADGVECAFNRRTNVWHHRDGRRETFDDLKKKYPDDPSREVRYTKLCSTLLHKFLEAADHQVLKGHWSRVSGTPLTQVVSDLNRAFRNLGYKGTSPFHLLRGDGYELLPAFLGRPDWMFQSELPRLRWVEELIELVRHGRWVEARALPGNGAKHIHSILSQSLPDARVINVNLASIEDENELLANVAAQAADGVDLVGDMSHRRIAGAAAGQSRLLVLVVEGWGVFAQMQDPDSLRRVAKTLQGFLGVTRPNVAVVLLSPTSRYHLLPENAVGSVLPDLQRVSPGPGEVAEIESWALERLASIPESEARKLIRAACGQLGATLKAIEAVQRNRDQAERLRAIREAHEYAAERILGAVGPCCRAVLLGRSQRPGTCLNALKGAGILEDRNGEIRPRVPEWAASWAEAGGAR